MKQASSRLGTLANSSKRLNKLLLLLASLAAFLALMCYWALGHFFNEEKDKLKSDFSQLMASVTEHENFLRLAASLYSRANQNIVTYVHPSSSQLFMQFAKMQVYESRGLPQSLPFTLARQEKYTEGAMQGSFSWGIQLTDFYNTYWASSSFTAPQLLMFAPAKQFAIAVPHINAPQAKKRGLPETFPQVSTSLYQSLQALHSRISDSQVRWMLAPAELRHKQKTIVGYIGIDLPERIMPSQTNHGLSTLVVLLEREEIHLTEHMLARPIHSHLSLISPAGDILLGEPVKAEQLPTGLSLDGYGLRYTLKSSHSQPWTGVYSISFRALYEYVRWSLLVIIMLSSAALLIGWYFSRWYRSRIVEPAERANQELTDSEAFCRAILENMPIGLCVVEAGSARVLVENQRAQQWQGTSELINVLSLGFSHDEQGEVQIKVAERHLQVCFASTRYQGKDVVLCGFQDITRHIAATKLMDQARHSADEASKAKTRFLQSVSHETRTPLYGVLGNLELLGLTDLSKEQRNYLTNIEQSSSALFQLISNVLDVSKIDAGKMAIDAITFCPLNLFEDILRACASAAMKKGLQIYACADAALPALLRGDPLRIRQIISNLLSNAIKFTDGGQVALRLKVTKVEATKVSLEWQVSDTGRGMTEEQRAKLFTPFSQLATHNVETGAGLGLSICARLCELMGANLRMISEPGLGSSFTLNIDLPIIEGDLAHAENVHICGMPVLVRAPSKELEQNLIDWLGRWGARARPAPQEICQDQSEVLIDITAETERNRWSLFSPSATGESNLDAQASDSIAYDIRAIARELTQRHSSVPITASKLQPSFTAQGLRVLIVEDNAISRVALQQQLKKLGADTSLAGDGEKALKLSAAKHFDLVITNVDVPTLNGYELARVLRKQNPSTPIIGVTVNGLREEGERCLAAGMNAWLVLPLRLQDLRETLGTWCPQTTVYSQPVIVCADDLTGWISMSTQMHHLFVETMATDLEKTKQALLLGDQEGLYNHLHRMNGALASVHAKALSEELSQWEVRLKTKTMDTDAIQELHALLSRIDAVVLTLGKNPSP